MKWLLEAFWWQNSQEPIYAIFDKVSEYVYIKCVCSKNQYLPTGVA